MLDFIRMFHSEIPLDIPRQLLCWLQAPAGPKNELGFSIGIKTTLKLHQMANHWHQFFVGPDCSSTLKGKVVTEEHSAEMVVKQWLAWLRHDLLKVVGSIPADAQTFHENFQVN